MWWGDEEDIKWGKKLKTRFRQALKRRTAAPNRDRIPSQRNRAFKEAKIGWLTLVVSFIKREYKNKGDNGGCKGADGHIVHWKRGDKGGKWRWLYREEANSRGESNTKWPFKDVRRAERLIGLGDKQLQI